MSPGMEFLSELPINSDVIRLEKIVGQIQIERD